MDIPVFGPEAMDEIRLVVRRVRGDSEGGGSSSKTTRPQVFHGWLARAQSTAIAGSIVDFALLQPGGDKGDETESETTFPVYVRKGAVVAGRDYNLRNVCGANDAVFEVTDPELTLRGKATADVSGGTGDFVIWEGSNSTGVTISSVNNGSSCTIKGTPEFSEVHWLGDDLIDWSFVVFKTS